MFLLLAVVACVGFSSCSGGDDDEPLPPPGQDEPGSGTGGESGGNTPASQLVGTWKSSDGSWGYTFNSDGTCICHESIKSYPGRYEVRSGRLLVYWEDDVEPEVFTRFSVGGDNLYLTDADGTSHVLYRQDSSGEEPGDAEPADELVGTWMESPGGWGYAFRADGTCICYNGAPYPGRYEVRSGRLLVYWEDDVEPEVFIRFSVSGNRLYLTDTAGEVYILYRQETTGGGGESGDEEDPPMPFIGMWAEDIYLESTDNCLLYFGENGEFMYLLYDYEVERQSDTGRWWVEYDEGELELHVSTFYTGGSNPYFSILSSTSSTLTLREEHSDEVFHLYFVPIDRASRLMKP